MPDTQQHLIVWQMYDEQPAYLTDGVVRHFTFETDARRSSETKPDHARRESHTIATARANRAA